MKNKSYIKYFIMFSIILISLLPAYNFYLYAKNYDLKKVKILTALIFLNVAGLHEYHYGLFLYHLGKYLLHKWSN